MRPKVILRRCEDYEDQGRISSIIKEGSQELGIEPRGRVLVKPNVVFAHPRYGRYAYTNPAVLEGVFHLLKGFDTVKEIVLGERGGVTVPTRYLFKVAGYSNFKKDLGIKMAYFDEEPKLEVGLKKGTVHQSIKLAKTVVGSDFKLWVPKLKNHVSALLTCTLKLNLGILDSKERLDHHDYLLEEKIADLIEVGNPDFIVVDGIEGGERNELIPRPVHIGVIVMGANAVAVDSVCARIMGLEPSQVKHLIIAHNRGWGPVDPDEIDVVGDVAIDELKERTRNLDRSYNDIKTMNTPVRLYTGPYEEGKEVCQTGCVNMLKAVLAIIEANRPGSIAHSRPFSIVIGKYKGDIDGGGERVVLVGDCTDVSGKITNAGVKKIRGCPVPVPFFMMYACRYGSMPNPYIDPAAMFPLPYYMLIAQCKRLINKI